MKTFPQENVLKFGNNNESVVLEPRPLPTPFSDTEIPLQTGAAKNTGLPLPTAPQEKGYIPRRSKTSAFLILFPATCG